MTIQLAESSHVSVSDGLITVTWLLLAGSLGKLRGVMSNEVCETDPGLGENGETMGK